MPYPSMDGQAGQGSEQFDLAEDVPARFGGGWTRGLVPSNPTII